MHSLRYQPLCPHCPVRVLIASTTSLALQLFRNGKDSEYKGPRDAAGIVSYMMDQAAPDARKVTALELDALLVALRDGAPEPQVVFLAAKDSDVEGSTGLLGSRSKMGDAFMSLSGRLRDHFSFAWTSDPAAAQQHGVKPGTVAVLHSRLLTGKLEPGAVAYSGSADVDALEAWLWPASLPLVGPLTQRSAPRYLKAGGLLVRVAVPNSWADDAKGANYLLNRLRRVAGQHPGLRLASMAPDSPLAGLTEFGIGSGAAGALSVTAQTPEGAKYAMPGTWSPQAPEALQAWLKDLAAGKVETYVKSQPVPEGKEGGVTVVVGRTFDTVVLDDTKDVLVEFYAPWCVPSRGGVTAKCSAPILCRLALTPFSGGRSSFLQVRSLQDPGPQVRAAGHRPGGGVHAHHRQAGRHRQRLVPPRRLRGQGLPYPVLQACGQGARGLRRRAGGWRHGQVAGGERHPQVRGPRLPGRRRRRPGQEVQEEGGRQGCGGAVRGTARVACDQLNRLASHRLVWASPSPSAAPRTPHNTARGRPPRPRRTGGS